MIRRGKTVRLDDGCKPRASGDDPGDSVTVTGDLV